MSLQPYFRFWMVFTKRIDRVIEEDRAEMLAMEDFCQLDYRLTQDKYLLR